MTILADYVVDEKGQKKSVVMSMKQYSKLLNYLEELEDAVDLKAAKLVTTKFEDVNAFRARLKKQGRRV
jgi:hypothetical protein